MFFEFSFGKSVSYQITAHGILLRNNRTYPKFNINPYTNIFGTGDPPSVHHCVLVLGLNLFVSGRRLVLTHQTEKIGNRSIRTVSSFSYLNGVYGSNVNPLLPLFGLVEHFHGMSLLRRRIIGSEQISFWASPFFHRLYILLYHL